MTEPRLTLPRTVSKERPEQPLNVLHLDHLFLERRAIALEVGTQSGAMMQIIQGVQPAAQTQLALDQSASRRLLLAADVALPGGQLLSVLAEMSRRGVTEFGFAVR